MKKKETIQILVSAVIWAAVIISCGRILSSTEFNDSVRNVLITGAMAHLFLLSTPLVVNKKKS